MAKNGISISVPIQNPAVFPVLADGVNPHNASDIRTPKKWTYDVKLPAGMTCDACVLQITQFMTDHGSNTGGNDGFFYHHCANVTIAAAAGIDAGTPTDSAPAVDVAPATDSAATGGAGGTGGSGTGGARATGGSGGGGHSGTGGTTGTGGTEDTGGAPPPKTSSGGCAVGGAGGGGLLVLLLLAGYFRYRARR
jgi:MYXO-CTERM domain-containing protein